MCERGGTAPDLRDGREVEFAEGELWEVTARFVPGVSRPGEAVAMRLWPHGSTVVVREGVLGALFREMWGSEDA